MKLLPWIFSFIRYCAQWMPTAYLSHFISLFTPAPWSVGMDREVLNTWNPLWYLVRLFYFYGPEVYGGWGGIPLSTICTRLQGMTDEFWRRNAHECVDLLLMKVKQIEIVIGTLVGVAIFTLVLRYLIFHLLFCTSDSRSCSEFPGMTNVAQYQSQWERMRQDAFQYFFEWFIVPYVMSLQEQQGSRPSVSYGGHSIPRSQPSPFPYRYQTSPSTVQVQPPLAKDSRQYEQPYMSNHIAPPMQTARSPWSDQALNRSVQEPTNHAQPKTITTAIPASQNEESSPLAPDPLGANANNTSFHRRPADLNGLKHVSTLGPQQIHFVNHYSSPDS